MPKGKEFDGASKPEIQLSSLSSQWQFFGEGKGGKTDDLLEFAGRVPQTIEVLPGSSVGNSYFQEFLAHNNLDIASAPDYEVELELPPGLIALNRELVKKLPAGKPVIVRSSAIGERGGNGIYRSCFFVATGDPEADLDLLAEAQFSVYDSFFNDRARTYRQKHPEAGEQGMSLLIQEMVGDIHQENFYPAVSGVLTNLNGEALLRIAVGMGSEVVDWGEAVVLHGSSITAREAVRALRELYKVRVITLALDTERTVQPDPDEIRGSLAVAEPKLEQLLEFWWQLYQQGEPYYLEFSIAESHDRPVVLQAAPDEIKLSIPELGLPEGIILCEGNDVINLGQRRGRGIFWYFYEGISIRDLAVLQQFNKNHQDFLLLVPERQMSRVAETQIGYEHMSNAAALVDLHYTDTQIPIIGQPQFSSHKKYGVGGSHFAKICQSDQILFFSHPVLPGSLGELQKVLGRPTEIFGEMCAYWDVEFVVTNTANSGRAELLSEPIRADFIPGEIKKWAREFWYQAETLMQNPQRVDDPVLAESFLQVCDAMSILAQGALEGFNPFELDKLWSQGWQPANLSKHLASVLLHLDETETAIFYHMRERSEPMRLESYLVALQQILAATLHGLDAS